MKKYVALLLLLIMFLVTTSAHACKEYCMEKIKSRMSVTRVHPKSITLDDGRVLIVGGNGSFGIMRNEAELYLPDKREFQQIESMHYRRSNYFTMTKLQDGRVLIIGGLGASSEAEGIDKGRPVPLNSVEIFDPKINTFNEITLFPIPIWKHESILLPNGNVLIAGGRTNDSGGMVDNIWIFDSKAEQFSTWGHLTESRSSIKAILLDDNAVIVMGGEKQVVSHLDDNYSYNPEIIDLFSHKVYQDSSRFVGHYIFYLGRNNYLVNNREHIYLAKYKNSNFEVNKIATSSITRDVDYTSVILGDNKILLVGGESHKFGERASSQIEVFNPKTKTFKIVGNFAEYRNEFSSVLLNDGSVLFVGGIINNEIDDSAELFIPKKSEQK